MQERKTGVKVNPFAYFRKSKMRSKPDPPTGSSWVSPIAEARCVAYESKFKEVKGDSSDPSTEEFDVEVAMLAGEGDGNRSRASPFDGLVVSQKKRNVRFWTSSMNGSSIDGRDLAPNAVG